jgi:hypothetical protein
MKLRVYIDRSPESKLQDCTEAPIGKLTYSARKGDNLPGLPVNAFGKFDDALAVGNRFRFVRSKYFLAAAV